MQSKPIKNKVWVGEVTVVCSAFVSAQQTQTCWQQLIFHSYLFQHKHWLSENSWLHTRTWILKQRERCQRVFALTVRSEFLHIDERLKFHGMCLWAVCYWAMSSPSYRKCRWCSHFNCWEATIWFIRRIVWISFACSFRVGAGERKTPFKDLLLELWGFRPGCNVDTKTAGQHEAAFKERKKNAGGMTLEHNQFYVLCT